MPAPQILATGRTVASNVARLRREKGISLSALSGLLAKITDHRRYPTSTLSEIEHARRRVDSDDLVALAAALDVSPVALLMPHAEASDDLVATSAQREPMYAALVWQWLLVESAVSGQLLTLSGVVAAVPEWRQQERAWGTAMEERLARLEAGINRPHDADESASEFEQERDSH